MPRVCHTLRRRDKLTMPSRGLPAAVDILLTLDVLLTLATVAAPVDFRRPGARGLLLLLPAISPPFLCFATLGLRWRLAFSSLLPPALLFDSLLLTLLLSESRTVYRPRLMQTLTGVLVEVYGWFTEGVETAYSQHANALRDTRVGCPCSSLVMAGCLSSKG